MVLGTHNVMFNYQLYNLIICALNTFKQTHAKCHYVQMIELHQRTDSKDLLIPLGGSKST